MSLTQLRKRAGGHAINFALSGLSGASRLHPRLRKMAQGVDVIQDVPYLKTGMREHLLDIYRPKGVEGPLPTVFYAHGGGYRILSKETHWLMGVMFAQRGFQVFSINYRLSPQYPFPAAVEDTFAAFCWMAENGAEYGADLSRLVLAGESAGGGLTTSLALALSSRREEPWAAAVFDTGLVAEVALPACPLLQVSDMGRFARRREAKGKSMPRFLQDRLQEIERGYLGSVVASDDRALELANPLLWLENQDTWTRPLPPFFIPVGTKDPILDDARRLGQALEAQGAKGEVVYFEGEVHAFHAFLWRPAARDCWTQTFSFMEAAAS